MYLILDLIFTLILIFLLKAFLPDFILPITAVHLSKFFEFNKRLKFFLIVYLFIGFDTIREIKCLIISIYISIFTVNLSVVTSIGIVSCNRYMYL